jgi:hypothetical protein
MDEEQFKTMCRLVSRIAFGEEILGDDVLGAQYLLSQYVPEGAAVCPCCGEIHYPEAA